jgi:predicted ATPase
MKINSIQIKNNFLGWECEEIHFPNNLSLLVGVSGAGKTQILRAIYDLKSISEGVAINGLEWKINFTTGLDKNFIWEGAFDVIESYDLYHFAEDFLEQKPKILFEKLWINNNIFIERDLHNIKFSESKVPKLPSNFSALYIFSEVPEIESIVKSIRKIIYRDNTITRLPVQLSDLPLNKLTERFNTLKTIKTSNLDIKSKLFLVEKNNLSIFDIIKNRFKEIFPQVENIKTEIFKGSYEKRARLFFWVKEKETERWIGEASIASGMLRTIVHLTDIYLSDDGSVILIDEFENSLGINCIDILTDDLIHENKTLQFIATSHHPYIINNIPYQYWKIVTRKGGVIKVRDASEYNLGKSKQDAFLQLTKILDNQSVVV